MDTNDRIHRRSGHIALGYRNNIILWGGYMQDSDEGEGLCEYHSTDEVWFCNVLIDVWRRYLTKGDIPPKSSGACGVILDDSMYIFGGYQNHGHELNNSNTLYKLNLINMVWTRLSPKGIPPSPCDKLVGWMYKDKIYFFGGFGPCMHVNRSRHTFVEDTNNLLREFPQRGWNNQFICYDVKANNWDWPTSRGPHPGPRAAHAADITGSTVCIFGGRLGDCRNNELHLLDMDTMTWSGNLGPEGYTANWPEGRSWCTLTFIAEDTAILYGGLNMYNCVLSDCWRLTVRRKFDVSWLRYRIKGSTPLLWHKATFFALTNEIYIIGGFKKSILNQFVTWRDHADSMLIIPFAPKSLLRICLDYIVTRDIAYPEDYSLPSYLRIVLERRKLADPEVVIT